MPEYPASSLRANEQGETKLRLCINASGRMDAIEVAQSSGFAALDNAIVAWARGPGRMHPAEVNGMAVSICNYELTWVWKLDMSRPRTPPEGYMDVSELPKADWPVMKVRGPEPAYPAKALAGKKEGVVELSICIAPTGQMNKVIIKQTGVDMELAMATSMFYGSSVFQPAMKNGKAVGVCGFKVQREWKLPR